MRILMATMGLDIGGAETHIVELAKELKKQGHDLVIVSNGGVYVSEVEAAGIRHYRAPLHRRAVGDMRRSMSVLRDVITREKPDVVHAHARIPAFLCGRLQKKMGFPFVTSCHGVYHSSGALKLLSNWGQRTLAVSEDIRDYLKEQYGIPEEQIRLTINGIDTEKFSPQVTGAPVREEFGLGEAPVIGHVSRLDEASSLAARQLIEIAPELDKAIPGVRVLITGGGDVYEELNGRARAINAQLGRDCLVLTGPRTDINRIVAACDLFVGVSRAALEAMSAGKTVILSGAQGHTGLFVPELLDKAMDTNFCCRTDPVATEKQLLADILNAMALPAEQKRELGACGRRVVGEHYSVGRMAQDALHIYHQVRRRTYSVVMSGYYGYSNAGDDAILESIRDTVCAASDEVELTVLSNDPELTRKQYGMNAINRFRLWEVFSALRRSDVLLSGGGSLLQDATSTRSLLYYLSIMECARRLDKPVMLYANGIGPVRRAANRRRVKHVVERASVITLRDRASARELKEMGVEREDVCVTADPVFCLEPGEETRVRALLSGAGMAPGEEFVAVSVRSWPNVGEFPRQLARLCDHLQQTYGMKVLFLMMQPEKDWSATEAVRRYMTTASAVLEAPCTPRELMGVLGEAKLCLAMRLHTLIFAARMAVPSVGLVYDPKVDSYLQELDLPSAGHVERFDGDEAIRVADELMADYHRIAAGLKEKSTQLTRLAGENERLLLELLEKTKH